mmetsp:Transcript_446/g.587  ORF Transcript_446/g.587 Transcript_446/m.587 type:complete len:95 (+) Transcript_446:469-753(+)
MLRTAPIRALLCAVRARVGAARLSVCILKSISGISSDWRRYVQGEVVCYLSTMHNADEVPNFQNSSDGANIFWMLCSRNLQVSCKTYIKYVLSF